MTSTPHKFSFFILLVFLFAGHSVLAATPHQFVKVQNRQLLVDFDRDGNYSPFMIKGAGYSPTPIGRYSDDWGYPNANDPRPKNLYDDPAVLNRDFGLLKTMNANTVRFWKGNNTQVTFADTQNPRSPWYLHYGDIGRFPNYLTNKTFDTAETYGIKIIAGFEMPWPGYWQCDEGATSSRYVQSVDFTNTNVRNEIIDRFRAYVLAFKDHPALLLWAIGNENNLAFNEQTPAGIAQMKAFYSLIQTMAQEARIIEGPFYHPVSIVNGDIGNIGRADFGTADADLSNIDVWGSNVYRGASFGDLFQNFTARSNKALWLSEFGDDAWQVTDLTRPETGREDQAIQAARGGTLWAEIKAAYLVRQSIGGTIMAYSDEWWKPYAWECEIDNDPSTWANGPGGCNLTHNFFGFGPQDQSCPKDGTFEWTPPASDHFFNEEWWGIMAVAQDSRPGYPDIMTPRQIYSTLQQSFFTDTVSPAAAITAPANNSLVVGTTITVTANVTDNTGVKGVQFKLDGNNLGEEDLALPYSIVWDSTTATDGIHTLTVVGRDADGNLGTASATVTVANLAPPAGPLLTSAAAGDAKVVLNWANDATAVGYTVRYGTAAGSYPNFIELGNVKTATVSGLINGTTYYFVVIAKYPGGTSQNSNELSAVLAAPDFVITELTSPATAKVGTSLVINNTVKNNGSVAGATFITSYYLSIDDQITPADIRLGTRTIPALAAGASSSAVTTLTIPSNVAPVTYYLGAIADYTGLRVEQNENNNALLGNTVTMNAGADLAVTVVTGPDAGLPGQAVTITDTLQNQGITAIGGSYVSYYLSADQTITINDTLLGNRYVAGLAAGASSNGTINVTIPSTLTVGTYYWGAIADSTKTQSEADETNNVTTGNAVVVSTHADLTMTAFNGPAAASIGKIVALTDTLKNQGTMPIAASYVGYYLSTDSTITISDTRIGARYIPGLAAGAASNGSVNLAIPKLPAGTYYWGVIADYTQTQGEADENNNSLTGNTIVIIPGADLIMTAINGPADGKKGSVLTVTDTVKNQGTAAIAAHYVGYYLSTDNVITNSDTRIGARYISSLAAGASSNGNVNLTIPGNLPARTYYWGVIADYTKTQAEGDENNNARVGGTIVITPGADLIMTSVAGPAAGTKGSTASLSDTVKNQGTGPLGASYVGYYLSTDATITTGDIRVGTRYIASIAAGAESSDTVTVTIPGTLATGTYYWGVIADYTKTQAEADETNNHRSGNTVTVGSGGAL